MKSQLCEISQEQAVQIAVEHLNYSNLRHEEIIAVGEGNTWDESYEHLSCSPPTIHCDHCWIVIIRLGLSWQGSEDSDIDLVWVDQCTGNVVKTGRA